MPWASASPAHLPRGARPLARVSRNQVRATWTAESTTHRHVPWIAPGGARSRTGDLTFPEHPRNATPGSSSRRKASEGAGLERLRFRDREDAAVRIVRISGEEKPGAGGHDDADAADCTIERVRTPDLFR